MLQVAELETVVAWHGALELPGTSTKGELLERRASNPSWWPDTAACWALGEGWGLNARRKRLALERRLADPTCPVRYCACGCGARIPVAVEDVQGPGRFFWWGIGLFCGFDIALFWVIWREERRRRERGGRRGRGQ